MALIKCAECGKEISEQAATCPHCGYQKPNPAAGRSGCAGIILAAVVAVIFISLLPEKKNTTPDDPDDVPRGMCMLQIKQQLHDPGSADFEHSSSTTVSRNGDVVTVRRPVRARNAANALRRSVFECTYKQVGKDYTLTSLKQIE